MQFNMEVVREYSRKVLQQIEDIWVVQARFREVLISMGLSPEDLDELEASAKVDSRLRESASVRFAAVRQFLDEEAMAALQEDFIESAPSSEKPS